MRDAKQKYNSTEKGLDKLAALHELALRTSSAYTTDELIASAVSEIASITGPDAVFFYLLQDDKMILRGSWQSSAGETTITPEVKEVGVCLCGLAASEKRPFYSENIHEDPLCTLQECKRAGVRSFAALPLQSRDRVFGVLSLASFTVRDFRKQDAFLVILCSHIAAALQNVFFAEELRRNWERYHALLDSLPHGVQETDLEGMITYSNPAHHAMFGYEVGELIGKSVFDLMQSESQKAEFREYHATLREEQPSPKPHMITGRTKNGKSISVQFQSSWTYKKDAEGRLTGFIAVCTDVTEQQRTEARLRENELFLKTVFENANDGILLADRDNKRFVSGNRAILEMLGYNREELPSLSIFNIHPAEQLPAVLEQFEKQARKEIAIAADVPVRRKDGSVFFADINASPVRISDADLLVGFFRDVTERRQAEEAVKRERDIAQRYLHVANTMLCSLDVEGNVVLINPKGCAILGYEEKDITGKNWFEVFLPARIRDEVYGVFRSLMEGVVLPVEYYLNPVLRKDGAERIIAFHNAVIRGVNGEICGVLFSGEDITEQKKAEESLIEANLRFSSLVRTASDGIIMADASGRIMLWNDGAENIFGYAMEDVLDGNISMLMPERYREDHRKGMQRLADGGRSEYLNRVMLFHGRRKDGTEFPLELSVNSWATANGIYFMGIIRDVTIREKAQEMLEEQKRFAERLMDNSAVATFVINQEHQVVLWNRACEELTGVAAAEVVGNDEHWKPFYAQKRQTLADVVLDGNFSELASLYQNYRWSPLLPNSLQAEGWYRNLNGHDRYILFQAAPIFNSAEELVFVIETLQDITLQKRSQEALQESEARLKTIFETEPHCVKLLSEEGTLIDMNPAGLALLEADSPDQVRGKSIFPFIAAACQDAFRTHVAHVFTGRMDAVEFEIIGLHNTHRWLSSNAVPFRNSRGDIVALLGITRDITEQKRLQELLAQSQKMEAVGQIAGGVAHDFNNILAAIMGYSQLMLLKMADDDPLRLNLEQVLEAAEKGATLTHSLLAFSRKQIISLKHIDLNDVIKRFSRFMLRLLREDIELVLELSGESLHVLADSGQIEQVLMNLVTNARDAMPGGGRLNIQTRLFRSDASFLEKAGTRKSGSYALIIVEDTGVGMDGQTLRRVFDPFFTTKEAGKGTGLGLSMVYGIIKQHEGYIDVNSELGRGSAFRIYLPIAHSDSGSEETGGDEKSSVNGGTETVLIAEDNDQLRKLITVTLSQYGYTVVEASDGKQAVLQYNENRENIHLVILDAIMPKMNGKEAYEEMKKTKPDLKVLFISGYTADIFRSGDMFGKEVEFMTKPFYPHDLALRVREILDR